jgi:hypothetical protein
MLASANQLVKVTACIPRKAWIAAGTKFTGRFSTSSPCCKNPPPVCVQLATWLPGWLGGITVQVVAQRFAPIFKQVAQLVVQQVHQGI